LTISLQLYDGLELTVATVQSLDEKGIAKKHGLKERDQILAVLSSFNLSRKFRIPFYDVL